MERKILKAKNIQEAPSRYDVWFGCDHQGFEQKKELVRLIQKNHAYINIHDVGVFSPGQSVDYPLYARYVCESLQLVTKGCMHEQYLRHMGVLICGSGLGMSMVANRFSGIRAARCLSNDDVFLARAHNNANILVLPKSLPHGCDAYGMFRRFMSTPFEGGRHARRLTLYNNTGSLQCNI